jgi:hypothetical protein
MSWAKLDDQFPDHVKVMGAGPLASWLHVCGLCYCGRMLTDGYIPFRQVRKLADVDNPEELAAILVREGLWEEAPGGYVIHDYLDYNPSREKVEATRQARSEAGRAGGLRSGEARASGIASDFADTFASPSDEAKSNPDPDPLPESRNPRSDSPLAARAARLKEDWALPDDWRDDALQLRPDVDPDFESKRFRDYWIGKPGRDGLKLDWRATWRNWVRNAKPTLARPRKVDRSYSERLVEMGSLEPG